VEENKYHDMNSQGTMSDVPSTVEAGAIAKQKKNADRTSLLTKTRNKSTMMTPPMIIPPTRRPSKITN
jgi:hypothetical protein